MRYRLISVVTTLCLCLKARPAYRLPFLYMPISRSINERLWAALCQVFQTRSCKLPQGKETRHISSGIYITGGAFQDTEREGKGVNQASTETLAPDTFSSSEHSRKVLN